MRVSKMMRERHTSSLRNRRIILVVILSDHHRPSNLYRKSWFSLNIARNTYRYIIVSNICRKFRPNHIYERLFKESRTIPFLDPVTKVCVCILCICVCVCVHAYHLKKYHRAIFFLVTQIYHKVDSRFFFFMIPLYV